MSQADDVAGVKLRLPAQHLPVAGHAGVAAGPQQRGAPGAPPPATQQAAVPGADVRGEQRDVNLQPFPLLLTASANHGALSCYQVDDELLGQKDARAGD